MNISINVNRRGSESSCSSASSCGSNSSRSYSSSDYSDYSGSESDSSSDSDRSDCTRKKKKYGKVAAGAAVAVGAAAAGAAVVSAKKKKKKSGPKKDAEPTAGGKPSVVEGTDEAAMRLEFQKLDLDGSGNIDKKELSKIFMGYLPGSILKKIIKYADTNKDGQLSLKEYIAVRKKLGKYIKM